MASKRRRKAMKRKHQTRKSVKRKDMTKSAKEEDLESYSIGALKEIVGEETLSLRGKRRKVDLADLVFSPCQDNDFLDQRRIDMMAKNWTPDLLYDPIKVSLRRGSCRGTCS